MTNYAISVNATEYTEKLISFETIERLNQMFQMTINLDDISPGDWTNISEGKIVKLFLNNITGTKLYKCRIEKIEYGTEGTATLHCYGMEVKLLDREVDRYEKTNTANTTILSELASVNLDGGAPWVINVGTNDAWANLTFRVEYDNRLRAVAGLANAIGYDWYADQDVGDNDQINIDSFRGVSTPSVTFYTDGASQNCSVAKREKDVSGIANYVTALGYGDGINQIYTEFFAASPVYTDLSQNETAITATLNVTSTTSFANSGYIKIGLELVYYSGKTGTTFTGCVRGIRDFGSGNVAGQVMTDGTKSWKTNEWRNYYMAIGGTDYLILSNTATTLTVSGSPPAGAQSYRVRKEQYAHYKDVLVFEYNDGASTYTPANPKANSSIYTNGVKERRLPRKEVIGGEWLEVLASKYIENNMDVIERMEIEPSETYTYVTSVSVGDMIYIVDSNTSLTASTAYRVVGKKIVCDIYEGIDSLIFEVKNSKIEMLDELESSKKNTDTVNTYMQGATNIYQVNESENAESGAGGAVDVYFEIPDDAVAINQIKLAYRNEAPRTYNAATTSDSNISSAAIQNNNDIANSVGSSFATYATVIPGSTYASTERIAIFFTLAKQGGGQIPDVMFRFNINGSYYPNATGMYMFAIGPTAGQTATVVTGYSPSTTTVLSGVNSSVSAITSYNTFSSMTSSSSLSTTTSSNVVTASGTVNQTSSSLKTYDLTTVICANCSNNLVISGSSSQAGIYPYMSSGTWAKTTGVTSATLNKVLETSAVSDPGTESLPKTFNTTTAVTSLGAPTTVDVFKDVDTLIGYYELPIDLANNSVILEVKRVGGVDFNGYLYYFSYIQGKHTHPVAYDIQSGSYTTTDLSVYTSENTATGAPVWTDRTTALETVKGSALSATNGGYELDLNLMSEWFSNSGDLTGWKGVRLQTDGNSRHKVSITLKCFIQSKTT